MALREGPKISEDKIPPNELVWKGSSGNVLDCRRLCTGCRKLGRCPSTVRPLVARAIRNAIRANRFARIIHNRNPHFYSAPGRFAKITRISDPHESPDSRESCELIRANWVIRANRFGQIRLNPFFANRVSACLCESFFGPSL